MKDGIKNLVAKIKTIFKRKKKMDDFSDMGRKSKKDRKKGKRKRRGSKRGKGKMNRDKEDRSVFESDPVDEENGYSEKDENTEVLTNKKNDEEDIFERDDKKPINRKPSRVPDRRPKKTATLIKGKDPTIEKEIPDAQSMPGDMKCYRNSILCVSALYIIFVFSAFPYLM